jgi:putative glycosyltransferase (TIGR04372 family)
VALLNSRAVGDTIFYHIFAASTKLLFDNSQLTICQRDDNRKYKQHLLRYNPHANVKLVLKEEHLGIPSDSFGGFNDLLTNKELVPGYIFRNPLWIATNSHLPDLLLSPGGMQETALPSFENPAFLHIPDEDIGLLSDAMVEQGVDPNRWFCCIHYREDGYQHRPGRFLRDLNPRPFMALVEDIVENLGGQVVRLGHPNMTPFPKRRGFIDLSVLEDRFDLHAFAVSRARFMVGTLSGISHAGSAFNTPTAITNNSDNLVFPGCWRDHDIALYLNSYTPSGKRLTVMDLHESGLLSNRSLLAKLRLDHGYKLMQNSPEELGKVTRELMDATADCQGWREPSTETTPRVRPNHLRLPLPERRRVRVVEYPDLAFPI